MEKGGTPYASMLRMRSASDSTGARFLGGATDVGTAGMIVFPAKEKVALFEDRFASTFSVGGAMNSWLSLSFGSTRMA